MHFVHVRGCLRVRLNSRAGRRFDEERSKKSKAIDDQRCGTVFLRAHQPTHEFHCRTSSGCRCFWGTYVGRGGHARTRYRVGHSLCLPMRKRMNVEEKTLLETYSRSQLAPSYSVKEKSNSVFCLRKKNALSSLSCQWTAKEDYTTVSCPPLFRRIGFFVGQVNQKTKEHGSMPAGPEAKESPGFRWLDGIQFRSPDNFFALWFSADSRTQKLNSDKFDQWRIRRRMWRNMYQYRRSFSHKVTTRRFCPQHPTLTPGAGSIAKTAVGRSIYIYIFIYISWQKAKSTRNCGARLRLAPIIIPLKGERIAHYHPGSEVLVWGQPGIGG